MQNIFIDNADYDGGSCGGGNYDDILVRQVQYITSDDCLHARALPGCRLPYRLHSRGSTSTQGSALHLAYWILHVHMLLRTCK